ncbi:proton-conducting transporter membrane subunit [Candidatus Xenohaliotis californiensis]
MALFASFAHGFFIPWFISLLSSIIVLVLVLFLYLEYKGKVLLYSVGGWNPPYGIGLRLDPLGIIMLFLINIILLSTVIHSWSTIRNDLPSNRFNIFYCILLIFAAGMSGIVVSDDLFNIYVFLEITALSTYTLIACGNKKQSLIAAFDYLVMGTLGSTFYLLGLGFLYAKTGTLSLPEMSASLPHNAGNISSVIVGVALIIVGLSVKSAIFPMHTWIVEAYSCAPHSFVVILAGIGTKINLYVMLQVLFRLFSVHLLSRIGVDKALIISSSLGVLVCSVIASQSKDLRRIFANSSIAQIGYIIICAVINTKLSLTAAIIHMLSHALAKSALFMVASNISNSNNHQSLSKKGLNLLLFMDYLVFFLSTASIIGLPFTVGFISKWVILKSALLSSNYLAVFSVIVGSIIGLFYFWQALQYVFYEVDANTHNTNTMSKTTAFNLFLVPSYLPPIFLALLLILLGFFGSSLISGVAEAVRLASWCS